MLPMTGRVSDVLGRVKDDVASEQFVQPVQLAVVEKVAVQGDDFMDREVVLEGEGHGPTIVGSTPLSKEFSGSNAVPANRGPKADARVEVGRQT